MQSKFDVTFPMFSKIDVNGEEAVPLYDFLRASKSDDDGNSDIAWNFTKFLVGRDGDVITRYAPTITPEEIAADLPAYL